MTGRRQQFKSIERRLAGKTKPRTTAAISARMSRVRQRSTAPELQVRRELLAMGRRYRISNRDLPGSPDIANRAKKWAVFVHGCFWHRHDGCPRTTTPKANRDFWLRKFAANRKRDERVQAELRNMGFKVAIVWECETVTNSAIRSALQVLNVVEEAAVELTARS